MQPDKSIKELSESLADTDSPEAQDEETVCFCHNVPKGRIRAVIRAGGCTLQEIQKETLASTGCGGCQFDVLDLLEEELSKKKSE